MEGGKMRVGIVVNDEMNAFYELTAGHREIALYDDRNHSPIFCHSGHVEVDVAPPDGPIAEEILKDAGDLVVGDFGIVGAHSEVRSPGPLGPGHKTGCENAGGRAKEAAAGGLVVL